MMSTTFHRVAAAAGLCLGALSAQAASFSFDTDAQGWTAALGGGLTWTATGGNTGGYLQVADTSNDDFVIVAPAGVLGDWSALLGGKISFDARNINNDAADWPTFGEVTLNNSVTIDLIAAGSPPPDGLWHHYEVPLTTAVWGAGLPALLANVTGLTIRGEFHNGVSEVVGFDNITISAVPELPAPALLLAGLAMVGAAAFKRRQG